MEICEKLMSTESTIIQPNDSAKKFDRRNAYSFIQSAFMSKSDLVHVQTAYDRLDVRVLDVHGGQVLAFVRTDLFTDLHMTRIGFLASLLPGSAEVKNAKK